MCYRESDFNEDFFGFRNRSFLGNITRMWSIFPFTSKKITGSFRNSGSRTFLLPT